MQTILGAGGAIGTPLAIELQKYSANVRLVSRKPTAVSGQEELFAADLLDKQQCMNAVAGSSIVYLTAGLAYKTKTWEQQWPVLIKNVIAACAKHKSKLVFFDNVYAYDPTRLNGMNEQTPYLPSSRKGKVRQSVAEYLMDAHERGKVQALIARSADFYGPNIENSLLNEMIIKPLTAGKNPQWLCDADQPHNFTYTPDAARATAQLGNDDKAYGQIWHLPTGPVFTGREWANLFATITDKPAKKPLVLPSWGVKAMGLAVPAMGAMHEMLYQYDRPYYFDSSKFSAKYGWEATDATQGLTEAWKAATNA